MKTTNKTLSNIDFNSFTVIDLRNTYSAFTKKQLWSFIQMYTLKEVSEWTLNHTRKVEVIEKLISLQLS